MPTMPDRFRASDLTDAHLGRTVRTRDGQQGVLRNLRRIDESAVQLLLEPAGGATILPTVGLGEPVEVLD